MITDGSKNPGSKAPEDGQSNNGNGAGIRVILADSQAIYRVGMRKVFALEDDIRVVAQAETLENLYAELPRRLRAWCFCYSPSSSTFQSSRRRSALRLLWRGSTMWAIRYCSRRQHCWLASARTDRKAQRTNRAGRALRGSSFEFLFARG